MRLLNEHELRAVIGHEMAHVKNRDTLTSSIVATIAGAISIISFMLLFFGGQRNMLAAIAIMILAPLAASVIQFAISRTREFAADEAGARIVRDPDALASALRKLHQGVAYNPMQATPQQEAVAALYIVHPFAGGGHVEAVQHAPAAGGAHRASAADEPVGERLPRTAPRAGFVPTANLAGDCVAL